MLLKLSLGYYKRDIKISSNSIKGYTRYTSYYVMIINLQ